MNIEKERANIRCKCGKFWGINLFQRKKTCNRCKTIVKARGERNEWKR
jgi:hypothetical protein